MEINDYIVVGSGVCGLVVAHTLVKSGARVLMLDVGVKSETKFNATGKFVDIRNNHSHQAELFLGKNYESLQPIDEKNPVHLTPEKRFTVQQLQGAHEWNSINFKPIESMALGGLANAWGLGSFAFSEEEMKTAGLNVGGMKDAYHYIANLIGISGGNDDAAVYSNGGYFTPQNPVPMDFSGERLLKNYQKRRSALNLLGFTAGRTPLAVNTEGKRNAYPQDDLDFHTESTDTALRPGVFLNWLKTEDKFIYKNDWLVTRFEETAEGVKVHAINTQNHEPEIFYARKLILAAGALGTARIVMRSQGMERLPVICNPYTYIPSIQVPLVGAANTGYQTGLAQLSLYFDKTREHKEVAMGSVYSYRSLMNFRLMKEIPLATRDAMRFLRIVLPALNVTGLFHPEYGSDQKYIEMHPSQTSITGDSITSQYTLNDTEVAGLAKTEKAYCMAIRKLGAIPLKVLRNQHGASIHYGGTLPFSHYDTPGTLASNGRLHGTKAIYVADGSGFNFLPGKGVTLSLMANAYLTALQANKND